MDKTTVNKNRIADALIELLQDNTVENITVTQLTAKAQIGKSTFYRTFSDIYEVFDYLFCDFCERCLHIMTKLFLYKDVPHVLTEKKTLMPAAEIFNQFGLLPKDTALMQYLFRTNNIRLLKQLIDRFQQSTVPLAQQAGFDPQKASYFARFIANGTVFSMLESYRRQDTIDTDIILFLLSLDITAILPGGDAQ
ncbi:MAG: TetR/AcrR family transcriptional regulator [Ruminococcaceae bacterium]|nr:TetR/AcrR family transcriptional regulator [Oscillospiraceae bacterium]